MITKYLERKEKFECSEELGTDNPVELEYYLIESEIDYITELRGKTVYGISIVKRTGDKCFFEEKIISNFSCCMNHTKHVLNKLANNSVTPVSLQFILDDMLGT